MSKPYVEDTIAAIATPLGEGGVGMIRMSGPEALSIAKSIFNLNGTSPIESHRIYHGLVIGPDRTILDEAILSYMKAPKSYTGEDVVEITCHGGVGILTEALEGTVKAGARLAERGEFTKRAFLNGKMDLAEAEAVIDLIRAR
ncbi:MAG: tRNA uridine-5-carboxymethylaminomethyl(34) synthesis GTPase MnmE, partial [Candidatus Saganbacteria bacterium]|nr:tRNA uridine-5-carboxymethylaminomethyl(34) synthesis GTPase MnmE [Candidatus Saganbacteria bacterium]